jgi:two-component system response regulator BaeR
MSASGKLVLIVEDEPQLAGLLADYLQRAGFSSHCVGDGSAAVDEIRARRPALVLLDLMLPGKDGMAVCRETRAFSGVPIIMVTARIEEIDRLLGLELGADDYICKPFSPREVIARVKAVLRRVEGGPEAARSGLQLDADGYRAAFRGRPLDLTAVEFQLLRMLASEPGRIFTRSQLMGGIYSDHRIVSDRTIDSHVKKLRRKISVASPGEELIHSVYGVGYKFEQGAEG